MNSITKKCTVCGEIKYLSLYNNHKNGKYGKRATCKDCDKIYRAKVYTPEAQRNWRRANPEKAKEANKRSRDKNPNYRKEYYQKNKERTLKLNKLWYEENKERKNETSKKWSTPERRSVIYHKRRARLVGSGGKVKIKDWEDMLKKYGKCLCCGRTDIKLTMDHVVPISLGGKHVIENLQPLCKSCNCKKGAKTIDYR